MISRVLGPAASFRGRRFAVQSAALLAGRVVSNFSLALAAVIAARTLGPEGRGEFTLVITVALLLQLAVSSGVNFAARVYVPRGDIDLRAYLGLAIVLSVANGLVTAGVVAGALPAAGVHLSGWEILTAGCFGLSTMAAYLLLEGLHTQGRFRWSAINDATGSLVTAGLTIGVALVGAATFGPFAWALVIGNGCQIVMSSVSLRDVGRPTWVRSSAAFLVRRGFPSLGLTIGQTGTGRADRYLVGVILGPTAVGLYAVAATVAETLRLLPYAVTMVLFQRVATSTADDRQRRTARLLGIGASAVGAAAVAVVAPVLVRVAFGEDYAGATTALRILAGGEVVFASYLFDVSILTALGRMRSAALASLAGFSVLLLLDVALLRSWGIAGAAWVSVVAYLVMATWSWLELKRKGGSS